jgi:hypothetical protein
MNQNTPSNQDDAAIYSALAIPHLVLTELKAELRNLLAEWFNLEELKGLCFDLGIRYEEIPGEAKSTRAMELVEYCYRHGRLTRLVTTCKQLRPHLPWPELSPQIIQSELNQSEEEVERLQQQWTKRRNIILVVAAVVVLVVGLALGWYILRPDNGLQTQEILKTIAMPVNLSPRTDPTIKAGTIEQILHSGPLPNGEMAVIRIYAPPGAPRELAAALFAVDGEGASETWLDATVDTLTGGSWTTLTLPLRRLPPTARLGLQFSLAVGARSNYEDTLQVSELELLSLSEPVAMAGPQIRTPEVAIYSFEECVRELSDWVLVEPSDGTLDCSQDYAFNGRHSLAVNVDLQKRPNYETFANALQLELREPIDADKLIVLRVYVPEDAPENITASLFLYDNFVWRDGHGVYPLPPGEWTTLTWSTKAVSWSAPGRAGLFLGIQPYADSAEPYSGPVYIDLVELYTLPDYHVDASVHQTVEGSFIESFEMPDAYQQWVTRPSGAAPTTIGLTDALAFNGRYSLEIETTLQILSDTYRAAQIILPDGPDLRDKVMIFRVYLPADAPTNVATQLFLVEENNEAAWGSYAWLRPGAWTTVAWDTRDSHRPWTASTTPGIEFKLQAVGTETDLSRYEGPLYIDLVEIIPLPVAFPLPANEQSLDNILRPVVLLDFEDGLARPSQIQISDSAAERGTVPQLSVDSLNGRNALRLDMDLSHFASGDIESNAGGIRIALDDLTPVDAITASIFVPEAGDGSSGDLRVAFVASSEQGRWHYSGLNRLEPGVWTPVFWGTKFAAGDDEWITWEDPQIRYFFIHVVSYDENGYQGPVYIDNIRLYSLASAGGE